MLRQKAFEVLLVGGFAAGCFFAAQEGVRAEGTAKTVGLLLAAGFCLLLCAGACFNLFGCDRADSREDSQKARGRDRNRRARVTHPSPALVERGAKPRKRGMRHPRL